MKFEPSHITAKKNEASEPGLRFAFYLAVALSAASWMSYLGLFPSAKSMQPDSFLDDLKQHDAYEPYRLDLNSATAEELELIPGIGPHLASEIIRVRNANGPFASMNDLQGVHGLGPVKAAALTKWIKLDPRPNRAEDVASRLSTGFMPLLGRGGMPYRCAPFSRLPPCDPYVGVPCLGEKERPWKSPE